MHGTLLWLLCHLLAIEYGVPFGRRFGGSAIHHSQTTSSCFRCIGAPPVSPYHLDHGHTLPPFLALLLAITRNRCTGDEITRPGFEHARRAPTFCGPAQGKPKEYEPCEENGYCNAGRLFTHLVPCLLWGRAGATVALPGTSLPSLLGLGLHCSSCFEQRIPGPGVEALHIRSTTTLPRLRPVSTYSCAAAMSSNE